MSYSTDLWCCISFLRKTYKTKEDVQEDLEEARSNIRAAKETITKLVYMTEPSKFFNFGSESAMELINYELQSAFDSLEEAQIAECDRAIELIAKYGYKGEFFMYTMLHGDIHECLERINHWRERVIRKRNGEQINATYPHAQPYRDPHNKNEIPQWQKDMAGWCNKRMIFFTASFEEFQPRKNFKCKVYLK